MSWPSGFQPGKATIPTNFPTPSWCCQSLEAIGRRRRLGPILRRENGQDAVALAVVPGDLHRLRVRLRVGAPEQIDGRTCRQLAARRHQRVRREDARPTGVGDDAEPSTLRSRLLGQRVCHVEEVGDGVDAQHAGPAQPFREVAAERGQQVPVLGAEGLAADLGPQTQVSYQRVVRAQRHEQDAGSPIFQRHDPWRA